MSDAARPYGGGVSDLQCPATVLVVPPGAVPGIGPGWPGPGDATVAAVAAPESRRDEAARLAGRWGAPSRLDEDLDGGPVAVARAVEDLADVFRGELVAVLPTATPTGCRDDGPTWLAVDSDGPRILPRS